MEGAIRGIRRNCGSMPILSEYGYGREEIYSYGDGN